MYSSVDEFRAKCRAILEAFVKEKELLEITRDSRSPAEFIPFKGGTHEPLFGRAARTTQILGDLNHTGEAWNVES